MSQPIAKGMLPILPLPGGEGRGEGERCYSVPSSQDAHLLIIGYGNTLRGDDGVGPRVAEAVEGLHLPNVRTLVCQQLSPEHAEPISRAGMVIFVDAAVDGPREVQLRKLEPGLSSQLMAHAADPRTMLALARDVFSRTPSAWWLTIPAFTMEFGETLSAATHCACLAAVQRILAIYALPAIGRTSSKLHSRASAPPEVPVPDSSGACSEMSK
jgi:hydrogenase maturation protease